MLILSRHPDQSIVIPQLDISMKVLDVRGKSVRVGIKAPRNVRVFRGEIDFDNSLRNYSVEYTRVFSQKEFHDLKNQLNAVCLAVRLLQRQRDIGLHDDANQTFNRLVDQVDTLGEFLSSADKVQSEHSRCCALLVEDNDNERELLAGLLRLNGYEVKTASDGFQALEYLKANSMPNVVLLDMRMPGCDGPQTIRAIRQEPSLAGLKVFAVSATQPRELGVPEGTNGVDRWFPKPLNAEFLSREMGTLARSCA